MEEKELEHKLISYIIHIIDKYLLLHQCKSELKDKLESVYIIKNMHLRQLLWLYQLYPHR